MRLVFICGAGLVSGKERQTLNLMSALKQRGNEVFCVMASWGSADFENLLVAAGIPHRRMRIGFISKTLNWPAIRMTLHQMIYLPSLWRDYRRLMTAFRPQAVVHSNFHHLFLLLPVLGKEKQVFHVHDFFSPGRFMKRLFRRFDKSVDLFVGVSQFICDSLPPLGVNPSKVKLVYNGVMIEGSERIVKNNDEVVIGIVGQIGSWKGHDVLLKSLAVLTHKGWRLNVIGEGSASYVARLREIAEQAGILSRVEFKGSVRGLNNIYGDLDIVCVPSVMPESFGLAAAEPGFFGIPVICSSVGALPEVVEHGTTGLVVSPGDVTSLAGALEQLTSSASDRNRMGEEGKKRVNNLFRMDVTAKQFEKEVGKYAEG